MHFKNADGNVPILINTHAVIKTHIALVTYIGSRKPSTFEQSKKISNDQELIQSDHISCPQNQKGNNLKHKLTAVYERHAR